MTGNVRLGWIIPFIPCNAACNSSTGNGVIKGGVDSYRVRTKDMGVIQ